jgi:iron complex outermembrane receptor protein
MSYNGSVSVETIARTTKHMSSGEYRSFIKTLGAGTDYGANTDWYDEITRPGISHQHNLAFSGGSDHTTYNVSLNYRNSQGVAINTGFNQINGRVNLTHKVLKDKLVFNVEMSTTRKDADLGFSNAFEYAVVYNPTSPVYAQTPGQDLAGGGYFEVSATQYSNPVALLTQNTNEQALKRLNFGGSAEYEFLKGLKFLIRYARQSTSTYLSAYSPK